MRLAALVLLAMLAAAAAAAAAEEADTSVKRAELLRRAPNMNAFLDLDPETMRKLVPPEIMEQHVGAAPPWSGHSSEERAAQLLRHVGTSRSSGGRRLQTVQEESGPQRPQQVRDDLTAAVVDDSAASCADPLASNVGAQSSCWYDCDALKAEFFPGEPARCFLYDSSTQSWPAGLLDLREHAYTYTHTFISDAAGTNPAAGTALAFTVGTGRECRDVTIVSTMMDRTSGRWAERSYEEVVCLMDGEHVYDHTITDAHTVEVVGHAPAQAHAGAGGQTSFIVGECTDVLIRVTTTTAGDSSTTWAIDDGGHNGPWSFDSAGSGIYEYASCMFDNEFTLTRQPSATPWQGSVEVVSVDHHNTITIPNDENWVVQGTTDGTGLPVRLDARLSSGTPLDRSHANIAIRYVRLSGQIAPVEPAPEWVGRGSAKWFAGQGGSYGGAFRYEGGSSRMPSRLTFDHAIFDHNSASSGGAIFINGRAGHDLPDPTLQNWESGITATWESCVFFRNWAATSSGAMLAANVWPMTFAFSDSVFIQNTASAAPAHDGYFWDSLSDMGDDRRAGSTSLVHSGTIFDGGFSTTGIVSSFYCSTYFLISPTPNEPDAVWNVTLDNVTYRDHRMIIAPTPAFNVDPIQPGKLFQKNVHVTDLTMTDNVAAWSHPYDSMYFISHTNQGANVIERSRFERNGCFNADAKGIGGYVSYGPGAQAPGFVRPLSAFAHSEWRDNAGGRGAAIYVRYTADVQVDQCVFNNNVATLEGGAVYFAGALDAELFIQRSIFEANAVRPHQTGFRYCTTTAAGCGSDRTIPATIVIYTDANGVEFNNRPVWRIDDGPVHGIGWTDCQAAMARSKWSTEQNPPYPPSWPSQLPSSCANETYHVETTYSASEMLTTGQHTLYHGVLSTGPAFGEWNGWIKVDDVTRPLYPAVHDYRTERDPGCGNVVGCGGDKCCEPNEVFWSSTSFRVSTGRGGGVAAVGNNRVMIRDSEFRSNEAPGGATLYLGSTLTARTTNTTIDTPTDEGSSAVSAFGAAVETCLGNPCSPGSKCTFRDYSTFCEACDWDEVGADGMSCVRCGAGHQPNQANSECVPCEGNTFSGMGICKVCPSDSIPNDAHTDCEACPLNQRSSGDGGACECKLDYYNISAINPACHEVDFGRVNSSMPLFECVSCAGMACITGCHDNLLNISDGWSTLEDDSGERNRDIFKCKSKDACPGGEVHQNSETGCNAGFTGVLCGDCKHSFTMKDSGRCEPCGETSDAAIIALPIVVLLVLLMLSMLLQSEKFNTARKSGSCLCLFKYYNLWGLLKAVLKIVVTTFQIVGNMTLTLNIQLPDVFGDWIGTIVSWFKFDFMFAFNLGCLTEGGYSRSLVGHFLVVFIAVAGVGVFSLLETICSREAETENKRDRLIERLLIVVFIFYPGFTNKIFDAFNCRQIGEDNSVMEVDYDIDCESDHYTRVKIVCVFLMIFWSILLPVSLLWSMYQVRLLIPDDKDAALLDDIKALEAAEAALTKGETPAIASTLADRLAADRLKMDAEGKGQISTPEPELEPDKDPKRLRAWIKRLHQDLVKHLNEQVEETASKGRALKENEAFGRWACLFTNSPLPQSWKTNVESAKEKEVVDRIWIARLRLEDAKAVLQLLESKPHREIQETQKTQEAARAAERAHVLEQKLAAMQAEAAMAQDFAAQAMEPMELRLHRLLEAARAAAIAKLEADRAVADVSASEAEVAVASAEAARDAAAAAKKELAAKKEAKEQKLAAKKEEAKKLRRRTLGCLIRWCRCCRDRRCCCVTSAKGQLVSVGTPLAPFGWVQSYRLEKVDKFAFVLGDYKKECWYWEVVELSRKLILAGIIGLVQRGSIAQTVLATLISFLYFAWTVRAMPFKNSSLNWIKIFSEFQLFGILLICIVLQASGGDEAAFVSEKVKLDDYGTIQFWLMGAIIPTTIYLFLDGWKTTRVQDIASKVEGEADSASENGFLRTDSSLSELCALLSIDAEALQSALGSDGAKAAVLRLLPPSDSVLATLRAGGKPLSDLVSNVLIGALEVLEQHTIASPRKARRPVRDILNRTEAALDSMDDAWCDVVSRSDELSRLAQLLAQVQSSTAESSGPGTSTGMAELLDCLDRCITARGTSSASTPVSVRTSGAPLELSRSSTPPREAATPGVAPPRGEPDSFRASSASATTSPARGRIDC